MVHHDEDSVTSHARSALVLYGSETGTAQDVALELESVVRRLRFSTDFKELNSIGLVCQTPPLSKFVLRLTFNDPGRSLAIRYCSDCHLHHWTGRSATERTNPVEEVTERTPQGRMFRRPALLNLRARRQLVSAVRCFVALYCLFLN